MHRPALPTFPTLVALACGLVLTLSPMDSVEANGKPKLGTPGVTPTPDEALSRLREGNARYVKGRPAHPRGDAKRRTEVAKGQKPFAVVLTCADSRVPPELIFDQGIGDLFVVRTAGQVIGDYEIASIEYAVEHLGSSFIMVLGHESCGAVKATIETLEAAEAPSPAHGGEHGAPAEAAGKDAHDPHGAGKDAHGPQKSGHGAAGELRPQRDDVDSAAQEPRDRIHVLVHALTPAVRAVQGHVAPEALLDAAITENVRRIVADLIRESPLIKSFLVAGRLRIAGARYDLDTGEVKVIR